MPTSPSSPNGERLPEPPPLVEGVDVRLFDGLALSAEANEYLRNRWLGEVRWFAASTRLSRRLYLWFSGLSLVSSSLTAMLAGISLNSNNEAIRWALAGLGLASALLTGFLALFQSWSNWKRRSTTLERLKSEGRQFLLRAGAYSVHLSHQEAFTAFVLRVEIIVAEHKTEFFSKEPQPTTSANKPPEASNGSGNAA